MEKRIASWAILIVLVCSGCGALMPEAYVPIPEHLRDGHIIRPMIINTQHTEKLWGVRVRISNNTANWYDVVTRCTFYRGDGEELDWSEVVFRQMPPYTSSTVWFWSGRNTSFTGRVVCGVTDETFIALPPETEGRELPSVVR